MAVDLNTFITLADSTRFSSRDIVVQGKGEDQTAKLGNLVFSSGDAVNVDTMEAFKAALEAEHGVFGTHAFDTVVGSRSQLHKSLRASDVKATLSRLPEIKEQRFKGELQRQIATDPKVGSLSDAVRAKFDDLIGKSSVSAAGCQSQAELNALVSKTISKAIKDATAFVAKNGGDVAEQDIGARKKLEETVADNEPTGLRGFSAKSLFRKGTTSIEDKVKSGEIGAGMRVNTSGKNPVLLDKLKTNGVEPGFITRNDWSMDDTRGMLADIWADRNSTSPDSLDAVVSRSPKLKAMRDGQPPATRRELAMAAGRAYRGGMSAVADFVLQRELYNPGSPIAKAFAEKRLRIDVATLFPAGGNEPTAEQKRDIAIVKKALFAEIRDAIMNEPKDSPDFNKSPIFQHFADRSIVKLDYNEGDRAIKWKAGSEGSFKLPERVLLKHSRGYRGVRLATAEGASAGAVREALANDITRLLGVPAQELSLVRGEYSDGKPKFMLSAKFATGYKDFERGFLKDGQAVPDPETGGAPIEPLGKYKALFLALADRDAVGSHGQNKGVRPDANGILRFFAIDPGHSLEGNGKYLEIHDDLSFKDTSLKRLAQKRFRNFSVFDDDTRFNKFQGVITLRELRTSPRLTKLFNDYRAQFNPNEAGISPEEKKLRKTIVDDTYRMEEEFCTQVDNILKVFKEQLDLYDALASKGDAFQEKAIETISNLEKLTSPTTWKSPGGEVELKHLAIESGKRVPWKAAMRPDGNIEYSTKGPLGERAREALTSFCEKAHITCTIKDGGASITVPAASADAVFAVFDEDQVAMAKHPREYTERAMAAEFALPPRPTQTAPRPNIPPPPPPPPRPPRVATPPPPGIDNPPPPPLDDDVDDLDDPDHPAPLPPSVDDVDDLDDPDHPAPLPPPQLPTEPPPETVDDE